MVQKDNSIKCPKCGADIDVNEVLYHQLEDQIKNDYETKSVQRDKEVQKQLDNIQTQKEQIEKQKESIDELVSKEVKPSLEMRRISLKNQFVNNSMMKLLNR